MGEEKPSSNLEEWNAAMARCDSMFGNLARIKQKMLKEGEAWRQDSGIRNGLEQLANKFVDAKIYEEKIESFQECTAYEAEMNRKGLLLKISTYKEWSKALGITPGNLLKCLKKPFKKETKEIRRRAYNYIRACESKESRRRFYRGYFNETIQVVEKTRQNRGENRTPYGIKPPYWC